MKVQAKVHDELPAGAVSTQVPSPALPLPVSMQAMLVGEPALHAAYAMAPTHVLLG